MSTPNRLRALTALSMLSLFATVSAVSPSANAQPEPAPAAESSLDHRLGNLTGVAGGLTAEEVASRAELTSPDLSGNREELARAALDVDRAVAGFFPRLELTANYVRLNSVESDPLGPLVVAPNVDEGPLPAGTNLVSTSIPIESIDNQWTFQASLKIPVSDYFLRLPQTHTAVRHAERAASHDERSTARRIGYEARVLYYNWVKAELSVAVAEQSLVLAVEQQRRVDAFVDAGSATNADAASARALVASSELLLARSKNLAELLRIQLGVAMHTKPGAGAPSFAIGEAFGDAGPGANSVRSRTTLTREALAFRPELGSTKSRIAALDAQAEAARSVAWPRLDAFATVAALNPEQRVFPATAEFHGAWQLGVMLTYSPNDTADGVMSGEQIDRQRRSAEAEAALVADSIRVEVADARREALDAEAGLESSRVDLAAQEEAYRARRELFLNDRATSLELTDAHQALVRARLDAVSARVAHRMAAARLDYVTGRALGGS